MTLISRKYIDDHDFVARYLADQLSDAERESFEAYYLEHPEVLRELNRTAQFKSGLMDLHNLGELKKLVKQRSLLNRISGIAIAASILLTVAGGTFWFNDHRAQPILAASVGALGSQIQSTVSHIDAYEIQRTRTSSYDATIELSAKPSAIELRVKPETPAIPAKYRITLATIAAEGPSTVVAETNNLQPANDGFVSVFLNASSLSPAIYELKIFGDVDTHAATRESAFLIELLAADHK